MSDDIQHRVACECPLCAAGVRRNISMPAELPDGRKVILSLSETAYRRLTAVIKRTKPESTK